MIYFFFCANCDFSMKVDTWTRLGWSSSRCRTMIVYAFLESNAGDVRVRVRVRDEALLLLYYYYYIIGRI
jgi:hypothetical protein